MKRFLLATFLTCLTSLTLAENAITELAGHVEYRLTGIPCVNQGNLDRMRKVGMHKSEKKFFALYEQMLNQGFEGYCRVSVITADASQHVVYLTRTHYEEIRSLADFELKKMQRRFWLQGSFTAIAIDDSIILKEKSIAIKLVSELPPENSNREIKKGQRLWKEVIPKQEESSDSTT